MKDALGRDINHLRISLTDQCNLRCFYCHREGNTDCKEMSTEEVFDVLKKAKKAGIRTIKYTGGEPLLRNDIIQIVNKTKNMGFDVSMTTNGTMLSIYAKKIAGMRVNIGCDTLTESLPKNIELLKKGLNASKKHNLKVKLNMVVLKGINDHEIQDMLEFCITNQVNLQLIELIDIGNNIYNKYFQSLDDTENELERLSDKISIRKMQNRKRYHVGSIFVELVRPNKKFCTKCNKLRITSSGKIKPCLMNDTTVSTFTEACKARDEYGYG